MGGQPTVCHHRMSYGGRLFFIHSEAILREFDLLPPPGTPKADRIAHKLLNRSNETSRIQLLQDIVS